MLKTVVAGFIWLLIFSCKNSNTQNKPVTIKEFIKLYKPVSFPINIADSNLNKFGDTTVDYTTFIQFIPDSAVENVLNNEAGKYVIRPAGIIHTKETDYLITNFVSSKINKLVVFLLDDKHHYKTALSLLNNKNNQDYDYSVSVTNEPTFIIRRNKKNSDKEALYSRNGFSYSAATNSFAEVLNDSNEDSTRQNEIINPIDTFASLNKFSGDYFADKKNFISLKDGKNGQIYIFFLHFEKSKDDCKGELKGTMQLTDATNAVYQESGDPCVIRFKFIANSIKVKEEGNCGNYRGINCLIDFTFKKMKPIKLKPYKTIQLQKYHSRKLN